MCTGGCHAACLLALDDVCDCRCAGRYHGLLADVIVTVDPDHAAAIRLRTPNMHRMLGQSQHPEDADLRISALRLDRAEWESKGQPISMRKLQRELSIGQARATELREWLTQQYDATAEPGASTHANGHQHAD